MATTYGVTTTGFVARRMADILAESRAQYEADTGLDIDWDRDLFLGTITANNAARAAAAWEVLAEVASMLDPNNATGIHLDNVGALRGTSRNGSTYSRATVTLAGTASTIILAGKLVELGGDDGTARWRLLEDATIGGGGTVSATFEAVDKGAVDAALTTASIVTPVSGWTSATFTAVTVGTARETDSAYRLRQAQSLQATGGGSSAAMLGKVLDVDGVLAARVEENDTDTATTIDGISVDARAMAVVVYPSTLTTAQQTALAKVLATKAAGTKLMGGESAAVTKSDGGTLTVYWDWASDVAVTIAVTVTAYETGYELADVSDAIEAAVTAYIATLRVGDDVRILKVRGAVSSVPGVLAATVTINASAADLTILGDEVAALSAVNVS